MQNVNDKLNQDAGQQGHLEEEVPNQADGKKTKTIGNHLGKISRPRGFHRISGRPGGGVTQAFAAFNGGNAE